MDGVYASCTKPKTTPSMHLFQGYLCSSLLFLLLPLLSLHYLQFLLRPHKLSYPHWYIVKQTALARSSHGTPITLPPASIIIHADSHVCWHTASRNHLP